MISEILQEQCTMIIISTKPLPNNASYFMVFQEDNYSSEMPRDTPMQESKVFQNCSGSLEGYIQVSAIKLMLVNPSGCQTITTGYDSSAINPFEILH